MLFSGLNCTTFGQGQMLCMEIYYYNLLTTLWTLNVGTYVWGHYEPKVSQGQYELKCPIQSTKLKPKNRLERLMTNYFLWLWTKTNKGLENSFCRPVNKQAVSVTWDKAFCLLMSLCGKWDQTIFRNKQLFQVTGSFVANVDVITIIPTVVTQIGTNFILPLCNKNSPSPTW